MRSNPPSPTADSNSDHISTQVLRGALFRIARDSAVVYWKPIIAGLAGFILGVASIKIELADALATARDAKEATAELRRAIKDLATERELQDTNRRVDDVMTLISHAQQVAEEPPRGKLKNSRK